MILTKFTSGVNTSFSSELNDNFGQVIAYQLVNAGQTAINTIKATGDINKYSLMTVDYFSDADGCFNTLESYSAPFSAGYYNLRKVEYVDSFATDGCAENVTNTCLWAWSITNGYACVTSNILKLSGPSPAATGYCTNSGAYNEPTYNDCYVIDFKCMCLHSGYRTEICAGTCLGNHVLLEKIEGGNTDGCTYCYPAQCYEFQKLPGTNCCYEKFCDGVSLCCLDINFNTSVFKTYVKSRKGDSTSNGYIEFCQVSACSPNNNITTNLISKTYSPKYAVVTNLETDGATNPGDIVYDLLCCDDTVACCGLSLNTAVDINAIGECCYKLRFCNNCCYCNEASDGTCMHGYAVQFIE